MELSEVNKLIADFEVGQDIFTDKYLKKHFRSGKLFNYTESLDALVPVWEKLAKIDGFRFSNRITFFHDGRCVSDIGSSKAMEKLLDGTNICEISATLTANIILELNAKHNTDY